MKLPLAACALAALLLPIAAHAAETPAVAVVRLFLADRATGKYAAAYGLLSPGAGLAVTEKEFAAGQALPKAAFVATLAPAPGATSHQQDLLYGVVSLFLDTHNTQRYTYTVVGPDPSDPGAVLVRADPPAGSVDAHSAVLPLLTVRDPASPRLRIDGTGSLTRSDLRNVGLSPAGVRRAMSRYNLTQLAVGIQAYAQDHDLRLPDAARWADQIRPYVKSTVSFHDPSDPLPSAWSYAYNKTLSGRSLALLENPKTTVLLFESTRGTKNASDTGQSVPKPGRHEGGTDYALADGHVKWFKDGAKPSFKLTGK